MRYYSDLTKSFYETEKECCAAEVKFEEEKKKKEEAKTKIETERKVAAKAVNDAYAAMVEAQKKYIVERNNFIDKYGYYHCSYSSKDGNSIIDFFSDFFKI